MLSRIYCTVFLTFTRLHVDALDVLQSAREERDVIGRKSAKGGKKGHLVAISWYYLHLPGEMRWPGCIGRRLYPERTGTGIPFPSHPLPRIHVTYRFTFLWVNVREPYADARRISCRPSHKARILLQEDSNSAHTRAPVARGTAERREKDRDKDIKNCPREPRESSRGINSYKPLVSARARAYSISRADKNFDSFLSFLLSNAE